MPTTSALNQKCRNVGTQTISSNNILTLIYPITLNFLIYFEHFFSDDSCVENVCLNLYVLRMWKHIKRIPLKIKCESFSFGIFIWFFIVWAKSKWNQLNSRWFTSVCIEHFRVNMRALRHFLGFRRTIIAFEIIIRDFFFTI